MVDGRRGTRMVAVDVAIATPSPTGSRRDHGTGSRWSEGSRGGAWLGPPAGAVSLGGRDRPARAAGGVSEREDQTAARLVSEDLVIPGRGYACG
jgi:hypothetical protein